MSTLRESVRAKAVIVLVGICFLSLSRAQELMGPSKSETAPSHAVPARHLDPDARLPTPPEVTYLNESIGAHNAPLADALEAVADKAGAAIDITPPAGLEKIVEHTAQELANDLLSRLLNGSQFDFVVVGLSEPPYHPTRILLMLRGSKTDTPAPSPVPPYAPS